MQSLVDKTFRNAEGEIVLAQSPNLPLITWLAATLLKLILTSGMPYALLNTVAFGALFTWAWLELFDGVNYFRRTLGLIVLTVAVLTNVL